MKSRVKGRVGDGLGRTTIGKRIQSARGIARVIPVSWRFSHERLSSARRESLNARSLRLLPRADARAPSPRLSFHYDVGKRFLRAMAGSEHALYLRIL